jgi:hypothetical protein
MVRYQAVPAEQAARRADSLCSLCGLPVVTDSVEKGLALIGEQ